MTNNEPLLVYVGDNGTSSIEVCLPINVAVQVADVAIGRPTMKDSKIIPFPAYLADLKWQDDIGQRSVALPVSKGSLEFIVNDNGTAVIDGCLPTETVFRMATIACEAGVAATVVS